MKKPADIKAIEDKIEAFQNRKKAEKSSAQNQNENRSAAKGFQYSIDLISGVFVGAAIGYFLDLVFHTAPIFLAVLTIFGGAAGILNIYKSAQEKEEEN